MGYFWEDEKLTPIEAFFDDKSYLETREIVYETKKNNLHIVREKYPNLLFSSREILEWAMKECEDTYVISGACSALDGADNLAVLVGKPAIDPLTNIPNTKESQKGIIGNTAESISSVANATTNKMESLFYKGMGSVVVLGLGYLYFKPYFEKLAKK